MPRLKSKSQAVPVAPLPVQKVLFSVEEAAEALSMGRTTVFALIKEGRIHAVKIGKRRLVSASELEAFAVRCQQGE